MQYLLNTTADRFPEWIAQSTLENLPALFSRQRGLKRDAPWNFVLCNARAKKRADVIGADCSVRYSFDDGHQRFAKIIVRDAKYGAISDAGTLHQGLLDFRGIDVHAATDDHVRTAIAKV